MSPVMAIEEWPWISETTLSGTPRVSITLAAEWRSLGGGDPERPKGVPRITGVAKLGGEHEPGLPPGRAGLPTFLGLDLLPVTE